MNNIERAKYLRDLRRKMVQHFDMDELETLAFDLSIDWDELDGKKKSKKTQSLIMALARYGRLKELKTLLDEERPNVLWPIIPPPDQQIEDEKLITPGNISEKALEDYLDKIRSLLSSIGTFSNSLIQATAQAYTDAVLPRLDKSRRLHVVRFLQEENCLIGEHRLHLRGIDLSFMNISDLDLHRVDLQGADFSHAYLDGANLVGANLSKAKIVNCSLNGTDLSQSTLINAVLNKSSLIEAILIEADLTEAWLEETQIIKAQLQKAKLVNIRYAEDASFYSTNLQEADLQSSKFEKVNFSHADLRKSNLQRTELWFSSFVEADLSEADLRGATLQNVDLDKAIMRAANLNGTTVWGEALHGANLDETDLTGVLYDYYPSPGSASSTP